MRIHKDPADEVKRLHLLMKDLFWASKPERLRVLHRQIQECRREIEFNERTAPPAPPTPTTLTAAELNDELRRQQEG